MEKGTSGGQRPQRAGAGGKGVKGECRPAPQVSVAKPPTTIMAERSSPAPQVQGGRLLFGGQPGWWSGAGCGSEHVLASAKTVAASIKDAAINRWAASAASKPPTPAAKADSVPEARFSQSGMDEALAYSPLLAAWASSPCGQNQQAKCIQELPVR